MDKTNNAVIGFALFCAAQHIEMEMWERGPLCAPPTKAHELGDGWMGLEQSFAMEFPEAVHGQLGLFWRTFEYHAAALCGRFVD